VGLRPTPGSVACRDPNAPRRSLAGALCAPPLCGNENVTIVERREKETHVKRLIVVGGEGSVEVAPGVALVDSTYLSHAARIFV
jgi:hypothetical protein